MIVTRKENVLATLLFELGAIKFASQPGEFKLKLHDKQPDAPLSPIYLNLRTEHHPVNPGPLTDEAMELIGDLFRELLNENISYVFSCIADIPDAGDPFGEQAARVAPGLGLGSERLTLHKEKQPDGTRSITGQVDGDFMPGDVCLLVDDLITGADTKLEAITALEGAGLYVRDILAVVDRQQGGRQKLQEAGYNVHVIFTLGELLDFYVATGVLERAKAEEVMAYIRTS